MSGGGTGGFSGSSVVAWENRSVAPEGGVAGLRRRIGDSGAEGAASDGSSGRGGGIVGESLGKAMLQD